MNREITVVTAFFNINRVNWNKFERSSSQYLEYFFGWAKIKNKLIVYVESEELKKKIIAYRASIGLSNKTIVHIVKEIRELDAELYDSICKISTNEVQRKARLFTKNPEVWNADYNYVMLLKMWCVKDAVRRGEAVGTVSWVDFGYNHGGDVLSSESDFNFTWEYDFPDKICLFLIQEIDERPIFDIVCSMDTYVMGTVIVGADHLWEEFWGLMKSSMISLNDCGLMDDDQNIILMAYRKKPQIFETYVSDWQMQLKQFGNDNLKVANKLEISYPRKVYRKLRYIKNCASYAFRIFRYYSHKKVH